MANKNYIDALLAAQAAHLVTKLKGRISETKASLAILECELAIAKDQAAERKVESS
jgi:hypothetical protein